MRAAQVPSDVRRIDPSDPLDPVRRLRRRGPLGVDRPEPSPHGQAAQGPAPLPTSPAPEGVAAVIAAARDLQLDLLALYLWMAAVTGARRGELCGLQWADIDLDAGVVHIAYSYLVRAGYKMRKDTKTHQARSLAIDPVTVAVLSERLREVEELLARVGLKLASAAYVFCRDLAGAAPWNPDWVTHKVAEVAETAGVRL